MTETIRQIFLPIVTAILGSGGTFLFFKQRKSKESTDAIALFPDVINDMLGSIKTQNETLNKIIDNQSDTIAELRREIQKLEIRTSELERINRGLQNRVNQYEKRASFSEEHICFKTECDLRKPEMGTFKGGEIHD